MKTSSPEARARGTYGILFLLSLPIPVFHVQVLGEALWAIRYPWGLHPIEILSLWHLGRLSFAVPAIILCLLAASYKWKGLCTPQTLLRVALAVVAFSVLYAMEAAVTLWMALQTR